MMFFEVGTAEKKSRTGAFLQYFEVGTAE